MSEATNAYEHAGTCRVIALLLDGKRAEYLKEAASFMLDQQAMIEQLQAREARLSGLLKRVSDAHWHEHSYGEIRPLVREIDCALSSQEPGRGGGE